MFILLLFNNSKWITLLRGYLWTLLRQFRRFPAPLEVEFGPLLLNARDIPSSISSHLHCTYYMLIPPTQYLGRSYPIITIEISYYLRDIHKYLRKWMQNIYYFNIVPNQLVNVIGKNVESDLSPRYNEFSCVISSHESLQFDKSL